MKKWIIAITSFIILMSLTYVFIPDTISINRSVVINNNIKSLYRCFSEQDNWKKWWPGKSSTDGLLLNGKTYSLPDRTVSSVFVDIDHAGGSSSSSITFIPEGTNNVKLEWDAQIITSYNPIKRLQVYFSTKNLAADFDLLLGKMKLFSSSTENLYGIDIRRELVKDSALVSTYDSSKGYPSVEKIYSLVDELRNYVNSQQAVVTDSPMLNIYTKDSIYYLTKVALPTSRRLPSSGKIEYRWMLGRGNILAADVKGGDKSLQKGFETVENYVQDHELAAPAIPFYSLITNRLAQPDSSKWITRIYYPIMYYYD
ncbi:MAG: hypothetical protein QM791_16665 [Ferruginibacter sp.]